MNSLKLKIKDLLSKKVTKKIVVAIIVSIIVASFLAVLGNSEARQKIKNAYYGSETEEMEKEFQVSDLQTINYEIKDKSTFVAENNDPQILLSGINDYVDKVSVYFNTATEKEINVELFYAVDERGIVPEQMLTYKINAGEKKASFYLGKNVNNIRLDLGTSSDTTFDLNCIKINEDINHGILATIIKAYGKCVHTNIFWDRLQIYFLVCIFISLNFLIDIKKLYSFIFDKRWIISAVLLLFLTVNQYTGDSITMYDSYVQTGEGNDYIEPVVGKARAIRSDEWLVNDSINLSTRFLENPYGKYNYIPRGTNTVNGNRFTLQTALNPLSLCSIFIRQIFGYGYAYAFSWWIIPLLTVLINIEFFLILTDGMKLLSACGASMVALSSFFLWWQYPAMLLYGPGALVCFYLFFNRDSLKSKLIMGYGTAYFTAMYVNMLYPAWLVPMGYLCLIVLIWMIKNSWCKIKKMKKNEWGIILGALVICLIMIGTALFNQMEYLKSITATEYPGSRIDYGGFSINKLLNYIPAVMFAYKDVGNPSEMSSLISLFPLPIILVIISLIKEKKKSIFTIVLSLYSLFLMIYTTVGLSTKIATYSLMTFSTRDRAVDILGYTQVVLLIWCIYRIKECGALNKWLAAIISVLYAGSAVYLSNKYLPDYMEKLFMLLAFVGLAYISFSIVANIPKKIKQSSFVMLLALSLITGICVRPITKGTYAIDSKPLAKKIQSIVKKDKKSKWLAYGGGIVLSGFSVACGAPTINSVNTYPNMNLWKKLDSSGQYNEVYNRYAHIDVEFTDNDTSMELVQADCMKINLSYKDIEKTEVKYIVAEQPLISENTYVDFEQIYYEAGSYIYKVIYK